MDYGVEYGFEINEFKAAAFDLIVESMKESYKNNEQLKFQYIEGVADMTLSLIEKCK